MSITASEARRNLFPLIEKVNEDRTVVEIVSRRGNAVLMAAEDYAALEETAYLLRSPENAVGCSLPILTRSAGTIFSIATSPIFRPWQKAREAISLPCSGLGRLLLLGAERSR